MMKLEKIHYIFLLFFLGLFLTYLYYSPKSFVSKPTEEETRNLLKEEAFVNTEIIDYKDKSALISITIPIKKDMKVYFIGNGSTGYSWFVVNVLIDEKPNRNALSTSSIPSDNSFNKSLTFGNVNISQPHKVDSDEIKKKVIKDEKMEGKKIGGESVYESNINANKRATYYITYAYFKAFLPLEKRDDVLYKTIVVNVV